MTSGVTNTVATSFIWVDREKRQRRELTGIDELMQSIATSGLIHFPIIKRDGELITGERRWTAMKRLGWDKIPVQYIDDLPEDELHLVELEENIRRVDISWQDQCLAVERYHELQKRIAPDWNTAKTAAALNMSPTHTKRLRDVAHEIAAGNEKVIAAPKLSTAAGITERKAVRQRSSVLATVEDKKTQSKVPLINESFHDWEAAYTGPKFNFIHCDFPYGVNADKADQGAAAAHGGYADDFATYTALLDRLDSGMANVVAESAHLMFWFSMDYYQFTKERLERMGWRVNPFPLIWNKSDNTGILPDPSRGPRRIYETAFHASRGDRLVVNSISNLFSHPGQDKSLHMSEKPVPMLRNFFRMFVDENSTVLDPTCGSGNSIKAALGLRASYALGIEQDKEFFDRAVAAFGETSEP